MLSELTHIFEGLQAICELPFTSRHADSVSVLTSTPKVKVGEVPSPVEKIQAILSGDVWFGDRARAYLESMPTIMEKEQDMRQHESLVQDILRKEALDVYDADMFNRFAVVHDDYSIVQPKVAVVDMQTFGEALLKATCLVTDSSLAHARSTTLGDDWRNALAKMLHAASISFPLETQFTQWQMAAQEIKMSFVSKELASSFHSVLQAIDGKRGDFNEACAQAAMEVATKAAGVPLESESVHLVHRTLALCVDRVAQSNFAGKCDTFGLAVQALAPFARAADEWGILLHAMRVGCAIAHKYVAVV